MASCTVTGKIVQPNDSPLIGGSVSFEPLAILEFQPAGKLAQQRTQTVVTNGTGNFSVSLPSGRYRVSINGGDYVNPSKGITFSIRVPNDGGTYTIKTLIENQDFVQTF